MSNENPKDILGVHPSGANLRPIDERDYRIGATELGFAPTAFDWKEGYDVEKDLGIKLTLKDQGTSSSCGGQTMATFLEAIVKANLEKQEEQSAKAPYAHVFAPGGGSNSRSLAQFLREQGIFTEQLTPSYLPDRKAPTEAFMTRVGDITAEAREEARKTAGMLAYAFPGTSMDEMAAAMKIHKGILIGIHGSNNGTWTSSFPSAKKKGDFWSHFMYGGKAEIVKGKKGIWALQSWGADCAPDTGGWQFISEDHWNAGRIWDAVVLIFSEKPACSTHTFTQDIKYGQTSMEVTHLQTVLACAGFFNLAPTGYYGDITARAVLKLRAAYGVDSSTDPKGWIVGFRTRGALNKITNP